MKKIIMFVLLMTVMLSMAACSSATEEAGVDNLTENLSTSAEGSEVVYDETKASGLSESFEGALSVETQLIAGTLLLEDTVLAVGSEQAETLLPLWKAYNSLSQSDTAAEAEISAIFRQIQDSMTAEQINAIAGMEITQEAMTSLFEELELEFGNRGSGENTGEALAERPSGNQLPEGMQPGGGQGFGQGSGQDLSPEQIATLRAERDGESNPNNRMAMVLVNPLIELLESKVV